MRFLIDTKVFAEGSAEMYYFRVLTTSCKRPLQVPHSHASREALPDAHAPKSHAMINHWFWVFHSLMSLEASVGELGKTLSF